jgi:hypothetical protein
MGLEVLTVLAVLEGAEGAERCSGCRKVLAALGAGLVQKGLIRLSIRTIVAVSRE